MANPDKTIRRIEEWQIDHRLPYDTGLSEDMCYLLMKEPGQDISTSQKYFQARAAHAPSRASVAVDTTTICSYSENLNDARFGYNKDANGLATVKLLTIFSIEDHQPIAFSRQPGNIPDVISVLNALKQLSVPDMDKPLVVLDGGFFSEPNIMTFIQAHTRFLMRGQLDGKWIFPELEAAAGNIDKPSNICPYDPNIYGVTCRISHKFTRLRKRNRGSSSKGEPVTEEHSIYLHFFLDADRARIDKTALIDGILKVKEQLEQGVDSSLMSKAEKRIVDKFLILKSYGGKLSVSMNDNAVIKESVYYGYFVLDQTKQWTHSVH